VVYVIGLLRHDEYLSGKPGKFSELVILTEKKRWKFDEKWGKHWSWKIQL